MARPSNCKASDAGKGTRIVFGIWPRGSGNAACEKQKDCGEGTVLLGPNLAGRQFVNATACSWKRSVGPSQRAKGYLIWRSVREPMPGTPIQPFQ
jgi:hypothetical protein